MKNIFHGISGTLLALYFPGMMDVIFELIKALAFLLLLFKLKLAELFKGNHYDS